MLFCHSCGVKAPDSALFCQSCGVKLMRDDEGLQQQAESIITSVQSSAELPKVQAVIEPTLSQAAEPEQCENMIQTSAESISAAVTEKPEPSQDDSSTQLITVHKVPAASAEMTDSAEDEVICDVVFNGLGRAGAYLFTVAEIVQGVTGLDLDEAKKLVMNPPAVLKKGVYTTEAESIKVKFTNIGAVATVVLSGTETELSSSERAINDISVQRVVHKAPAASGYLTDSKAASKVISYRNEKIAKGLTLALVILWFVQAGGSFISIFTGAIIEGIIGAILSLAMGGWLKDARGDIGSHVTARLKASLIINIVLFGLATLGTFVLIAELGGALFIATVFTGAMTTVAVLALVYSFKASAPSYEPEKPVKTPLSGKKKRGILIAVLSVSTAIILAIVIPVAVSNANRNTMDSDYFRFGRDRVPTVGNILGWRSGNIRSEVRDSGNDRWRLSVGYTAASDIAEDMRRYAQALYEHHGFMLLDGSLADHGFNPQHGTFYMLGKPSELDGYYLAVLIRRDEFEHSRFDVTYLQRRGRAELGAASSDGLAAVTVQEPVSLGLVHTCDDDGFAFEYPSWGWTVLVGDALRRELVDPSPYLILDLRRSQAVGYASQLRIIKEPFDSFIFTANEWQFAAYLAGLHEDFELIETSFVDINGITARRAVFTFTHSDGFVRTATFYIYAAGNYTYSVFYIHRLDRGRDGQIFAAIMDTFTITHPAAVANPTLPPLTRTIRDRPRNISINIPEAWDFRSYFDGIILRPDGTRLEISVSVESAEVLEGDTLSEIMRFLSFDPDLEVSGFAFDNGISGYMFVDLHYTETIFMYEADGLLITVLVDHSRDGAWFDANRELMYAVARTVTHR